MATKTDRKIEWIIIFILGATLIGSVIFYYSNQEDVLLVDTEPTNKQAELLMKDYQSLEDAYDKAIKEIEGTVANDDVGITILKENLSQILTDIKKEKNRIDKQRHARGVDSMQYHMEQTESMKDMLEMSKEVLVERIAEMQRQNQELVQDNERLQTRNEKLDQKLTKASTFYEQEKSKNANLNAEISRVKTQIKQIESSEVISTKELEKLKQQQKLYEDKLEESNHLIEVQNEQINELGVILRKINVECYFIFAQGDEEEEAKIFLTERGIARRYLKYFLSNKPDITFDFIINEYMFEEGTAKVEFKLFNENDIEVYNTSKSIDKGLLKIVVPHRNFTSTTAYYIKLKESAEDLLIGGKYEFRLGK